MDGNLSVHGLYEAKSTIPISVISSFGPNRITEIKKEIFIYYKLGNTYKVVIDDDSHVEYVLCHMLDEYIENKSLIKKVEGKEDNHEGMVYNPISETWSWF
jgi:hypothetical protein